MDKFSLLLSRSDFKEEVQQSQDKGEKFSIINPDAIGEKDRVRPIHLYYSGQTVAEDGTAAGNFQVGVKWDGVPDKIYEQSFTSSKDALEKFESIKAQLQELSKMVSSEDQKGSVKTTADVLKTLSGKSPQKPTSPPSEAITTTQASFKTLIDYVPDWVMSMVGKKANPKPQVLLREKMYGQEDKKDPLETLASLVRQSYQKKTSADIPGLFYADPEDPGIKPAQERIKSQEQHIQEATGLGKEWDTVWLRYRNTKGALQELLFKFKALKTQQDAINKAVDPKGHGKLKESLKGVSKEIRDLLEPVFNRAIAREVQPDGVQDLLKRYVVLLEAMDEKNNKAEAAMKVELRAWNRETGQIYSVDEVLKKLDEQAKLINAGNEIAQKAIFYATNLNKLFDIDFVSSIHPGFAKGSSVSGVSREAAVPDWVRKFWGWLQDLFDTVLRSQNDLLNALPKEIAALEAELGEAQPK